MEIGYKARLHNEFTIEVRDAKTRTLKQVAKAYNMILDQGFNRLLTAFKSAYFATDMTSYVGVMHPKSKSDVNGAQTYRFGGAIHLGSGTGTVAPSDTTLFNFVLGRYSDFHDRNYDNDALTGYYTQKIVLNPEEYVGQTFTEVGLAATTSATYLSTKALIVDAEGNPLSITKTALDVITVYSKVYVTINPSNPRPNFYMPKFQSGSTESPNSLLAWIVNSGAFDYNNCLTIYTGGSCAPTFDKLVSSIFVYDQSFKKQYSSSICTVDNVSRKISYNVRLGITEANGKIYEVTLTKYHYTNDVLSGEIPLFRSVMPLPGVWEGAHFSNELLGTGDDINTDFNFKWDDIREGGTVIKVDGVVKQEDVDYILNDKASLGMNLVKCKGVIITANSVAKDNTKPNVYEPIMVVGSSSAVYWKSAAGPFPHWLEVDFDKTVYTNKVRILPGDARPNHVEVQGFNETTGTWDTICTATLTNSATWQELTFNEVSYKKFKLNILDVYYGYTYVSVSSLEIISSRPNIRFISPPAVGTTVTADYDVDYIPKDADHVLDVGFSITFADGNSV